MVPDMPESLTVWIWVQAAVPVLLLSSILIAVSVKDRRVPLTVRILISVIAFQSGRSTPGAGSSSACHPLQDRRHDSGVLLPLARRQGRRGRRFFSSSCIKDPCVFKGAAAESIAGDVSQIRVHSCKMSSTSEYMDPCRDFKAEDVKCHITEPRL